MSQFFMTVGYPRSGKSSWVREHYPHCIVVCPDEIRLSLYGQRYYVGAEPFVWGITQVIVDVLVKQNKAVVLDATNTTKLERAHWIKYRPSFVVFDIPAQTCRERALAANQADLIPVIDRMEWHFEIPALNEGKIWMTVTEEDQHGVE